MQTRWVAGILLMLPACGCGWTAGPVHAGAPPKPVAAKPIELRDPDAATRGSLREVWRFPITTGKCHTGITAVTLDRGNEPGIAVRTAKEIVLVSASGKRVTSLPVTQEIGYLAGASTPSGSAIVGFDTWSQGVALRDMGGRRIWRYAVADAVDWACPVDIHDPRGDAVAIGYNGDGGVRLVSAAGKLLWQAKRFGNAWSVSAARLSRGAPQSILCAQGPIVVLDSSGRKIGELGKDADVDAGSVFGGDLDGDGVDEAFGLGKTVVSGGFLSVYNADGKLRWRQRIVEKYAALDGPILVGAFFPGGRQVVVGYADGNALFFGPDGKPMSRLQVVPNLVSFCALPGKDCADRLVAATSDAVICYAWQAGKPSHIPSRYLALPPRKPEQPLIEAVMNGDIPAASSLLATGADPNAKNRQGSPALVIAADRNRAEVVKLLLDKGADADARRADGDTALSVASVQGYAPIVRELLNHKADPNAAGERGWRPLIHAASSESVETVRLLLDAGADPNGASPEGDTALKWAAEYGSEPMVELLLARGAAVDPRDWMGSTPLMDAARAGHAAVVRALLAHGANPNARTDTARIVYWGAGFSGDKAEMEWLRKSGKLDKLHEDGPGVLFWARSSRNKEVVDLVEQAGGKLAPRPSLEQFVPPNRRRSRSFGQARRRN